jgi:nitroimidazol reductase NimA-like FMN-containing flavoprotein (pyridoxamine 5'-phosphate oxidase superfamily)
MTSNDDLVRAIVDANRYMTLATADADGTPWASPVWYAHRDHREFLWVSRPDARHSRNLAGRPQLGIVIFDSTAAVGTGEAVYVEAIGGEVAGPDRDDAIEAFSQRSQAQGAPAWTGADVTAPAPHRLYRAVVSQHFLLEGGDRRVAVEVG